MNQITTLNEIGIYDTSNMKSGDTVTVRWPDYYQPGYNHISGFKSITILESEEETVKSINQMLLLDMLQRDYK